MINKKKIIALVPARGGSTGIKNKNIKNIKKKSLIKITSDFIDNSKIFDYKVLNSDSSKILQIGKKCNFVNIKRPKKLSGSRISDFQIIDYSINKFEKMKVDADYLVYLQPTSPIRKKNQLIYALKKVIFNDLDGCWSVTKINTKYHPLKILFSDKGRLKLFLKDGKNIIARQMLKDVYIRNGVFYIFSIKELKKQKTIYLKNMIVSESNYKTVNIDNIKDLREARRIF